MHFTTWVFRKALERGYFIKRVSKAKDINRFISRFRENYVSVELERVGGEGDGGYLVPNVLHDISHCFSPGVDYKADFENQLANQFGITSHMADASVESTPIENDHFKFIRKFIGNKTEEEFITLGDWIRESVGDDCSDMILQMDIEGAEYEVLLFEPEEVLNKFSVIIVEFHNFQNIFEPDFLSSLSSAFEKIYKNFRICHVHPNNINDIEVCHGIEVPRVVEITFLKKDWVSKVSSNVPVELPHQLDRKNVDNLKDVKMPEIWWKH